VSHASDRQVGTVDRDCPAVELKNAGQMDRGAIRRSVDGRLQVRPVHRNVVLPDHLYEEAMVSL
jgi:hypothetical protein